MNEQWYTNKELFEQMLTLQNNFKDLSAEMKETRDVIRKYNRLREELGEMDKRVTNVNEELRQMGILRKSRHDLSEGVRKWGGWLFAGITLAVLILKLWG